MDGAYRWLDSFVEMCLCSCFGLLGFVARRRSGDRWMQCIKSIGRGAGAIRFDRLRTLFDRVPHLRLNEFLETERRRAAASFRLPMPVIKITRLLERKTYAMQSIQDRNGKDRVETIHIAFTNGRLKLPNSPGPFFLFARSIDLLLPTPPTNTVQGADEVSQRRAGHSQSCRPGTPPIGLLMVRPAISLCLHVVTKQIVLIEQIQLAVGDHRMSPGQRLASVGLIEPAALDISLRTGFDEQNGAVFQAAIEAATRSVPRDVTFASAIASSRFFKSIRVEFLSESQFAKRFLKLLKGQISNEPS